MTIELRGSMPLISIIIIESYNMKRHLNLYKLSVVILLTVGSRIIIGCDMMKTDLSDCPTGLYVSFKYDYNIQRSDMFRDHVGGVTLYVFDENNRFVMQQEENNVAEAGYTPLKQYDYKMHIKVPEGKYRLVALAHQKSYEETQKGKGAKYRRTQLQPGDDISKLQVTLDRELATTRIDASNPAIVNNQGMPMDTAFHAINKTHIAASSIRASFDTLSMVRNTKMLTVSLRQLDDEANISTDDFEVYILDNNGTTNYDNSVLGEEDLKYTPHDTWITDFADASGNVLQRAAHYGLTFNRLIYYSNPNDNALLVIVNKKTKAEVAVINLPDCLAQGRNAVERYQYSAQEFLDREYNYKLDFFLKGDTWQYVDLSISILSWSKRIQRVSL